MGQVASKGGSIKYELVDILETVAGKDQESILVLNESTGKATRW